jgi:hypothetical protein
LCFQLAESLQARRTAVDGVYETSSSMSSTSGNSLTGRVRLIKSKIFDAVESIFPTQTASGYLLGLPFLFVFL